MPFRVGLRGLFGVICRWCAVLESEVLSTNLSSAAGSMAIYGAQQWANPARLFLYRHQGRFFHNLVPYMIQLHWSWLSFFLPHLCSMILFANLIFFVNLFPRSTG